MIRTVLGDISPNNLGFCDAHDHVLIHGGVGVIKNADLDVSDREKGLVIFTPNLGWTRSRLPIFKASVPPR